MTLLFFLDLVRLSQQVTSEWYECMWKSSCGKIGCKNMSGDTQTSPDVRRMTLHWGTSVRACRGWSPVTQSRPAGSYHLNVLPPPLWGPSFQHLIP